MTNVRDALAAAAAQLAAAGCDAPRLDAELLLGDVLGAGRAWLYAEPRRALTPLEGRHFAALLARRAAREPLAYVRGRRWFRELELEVDSRVLVPRPETELLVDVALGLVPPLPRGARVLDAGTGSGAIALALKQERPDLNVAATDASAGALAVARANAERFGIDVELGHGDLLAGRRADAVLSNPPYVRDGERDALAPEIRDHEPATAVFAGADGLDVLRRLPTAAAAAGALFVALEVGAGQAVAVSGLLAGAGFADVRVHRDLAGIDRVVAGRRQ